MTGAASARSWARCASRVSGRSYIAAGLCPTDNLACIGPADGAPKSLLKPGDRRQFGRIGSRHPPSLRSLDIGPGSWYPEAGENPASGSPGNPKEVTMRKPAAVMRPAFHLLALLALAVPLAPASSAPGRPPAGRPAPAPAEAVPPPAAGGEE